MHARQAAPSSFHAERGLEVLHTDLCVHITPLTPGGQIYFLFIVDDFSHFMRVELLSTNDQELAYIKKIKTKAKVELGVISRLCSPIMEGSSAPMHFGVLLRIRYQALDHHAIFTGTEWCG